MMRRQGEKKRGERTFGVWYLAQCSAYDESDYLADAVVAYPK